MARLQLRTLGVWWPSSQSSSSSKWVGAAAWSWDSSSQRLGTTMNVIASPWVAPSWRPSLQLGMAAITVRSKQNKAKATLKFEPWWFQIWLQRLAKLMDSVKCSYYYWQSQPTQLQIWSIESERSKHVRNTSIRAHPRGNGKNQFNDRCPLANFTTDLITAIAIWSLHKVLQKQRKDSVSLVLSINLLMIDLSVTR